MGILDPSYVITSLVNNINSLNQTTNHSIQTGHCMDLLICDTLQQKVPEGPSYKLLVLYQFYSAISTAVFSSQEVQYNRMQAMTQHN